MPSFKVVGQSDLLGPQTKQTIATALGYFPELDGQILLLKTSHLES